MPRDKDYRKMSEGERFGYLRAYIRQTANFANAAEELAKMMLQATEEGPSRTSPKILNELLLKTAGRAYDSYRRCYAISRVLHSLFGTPMLSRPKPRKYES